MGLDPKTTSAVFEQIVRMRVAGTAVLLDDPRLGELYLGGPPAGD